MLTVNMAALNITNLDIRVIYFYRFRKDLDFRFLKDS